MKERPIIMSTEEVRGFLENRRSMVRRVIKPQPPVLLNGYTWRISGNSLCAYKFHVEDLEVNAAEEYIPHCKCPYEVGDRLWVKETWWQGFPLCKDDKVYYKATDTWTNPPWKSPIFMPRWASRIEREITGIRAERLQDISARDCEAEGIEGKNMLDPYIKNDYHILWDSLNAKRGHPWEANDWVWVISF